MRLPAAALLLILATSAASADTIAGRASAIDGDTIDIHGQRIRILDIDAPESKQICIDSRGIDFQRWFCAAVAANKLSDWIGTRTVTCETTKLDRYKRHLAHCMVGWQDIGV